MVPCRMWVRLLLFGPVLALAQSSTDISLNITLPNLNYSSSNTFVLTQTGMVAPLGNATIVSTSSTWPIGSSGVSGPAQLTLALAFNELDSVKHQLHRKRGTS